MIVLISYNDFPCYEGLSTRIDGLARGLTTAGHKVVVLAPNVEFVQPAEEVREGYRIVRVDACVPSWLARHRIPARAFSVFLYALRSLHAWKDMVRGETVHLLQAEQTYALLAALLLRCKIAAPVILDDATFVSEMMAELGHPWLGRLFSWVERRLFARCQGFVGTSEACRSYLMMRGAQESFRFPNGVDTDRFQPTALNRTCAGPGKLFFNGSALNSQNLQALRNALMVYHRVRDRHGLDVELHLVCGPLRYVPEDLRQEVTALAPSVCLEDSVPDIVPLIQQADLALLPYSRGHHITGGSRLKALEYLACSKVVMATPEGVEGIPELQAGQHFLLAESLDQMADQAAEVLRAPERFAFMGCEGRELVERHYSWKGLGAEYVRYLAQQWGITASVSVGPVEASL